MAHHPLKFFAVRGVPGTYEVRRDGVLLGCVSEFEKTVVTRSTHRASLRKVRRWRFQRVGADAARLLYTTRTAAAKGLEVVFDAFARNPRNGEG